MEIDQKEYKKLKTLEKFCKEEVWQFMLCANDVFAWACADAQTINCEEALDEILYIYDKYQYEGILALMSHVRNCDPQEPIWECSNKKKYLEARREIRELAIKSVESQIKSCEGLAEFKKDMIDEHFGFVDWSEDQLIKANKEIEKLKAPPD